MEVVISDSDMPVSPLNLNLAYQVLRDLSSKAEGLCWWLRAERKESWKHLVSHIGAVSGLTGRLPLSSLLAYSKDQVVGVNPCCADS